MKVVKRILPAAMAAALVVVSVPATALADTSNVVTLGADLTDEQKQSMYDYFGTSADEVTTITVTNADEREYMEGIASEEQIGTRTLSCSYVEPTESGGIQVKVANLTYVTSSMIASTLVTSGIENANVVAACPIAVSGTGALTGIMMAYESATGEELDEDKKEAATAELVTTGDLGSEVGDDAATQIVNDVKEQVLSGDATDTDSITTAVTEAADKAGVTLTDEQINEIVDLMSKISSLDYDDSTLKEALSNLNGDDEGGLVSGIIDTIKGLFGGSDSDGGIINDTDDSVLSDDAVVDSTLDDSSSDSGSSDSGSSDEGFFGKIKNFFADLFGGSDSTDSSATDNEGSDSSSVVAEASDLAVESSDSADASDASDETTDSAIGDGTETTDTYTADDFADDSSVSDDQNGDWESDSSAAQ